MRNYNKIIRYSDNHGDNLWKQMTEVNKPNNSKFLYWQNRIVNELNFLGEIAKITDDKKMLEDIEIQSEILEKYVVENQVIDKKITQEIEKNLENYSAICKDIKIHCVSHAHIDMNWMWGFHETVDITIATFKTMLALLKEYKDFTYSQSQASTYKIIEDYAPELIEDIKKYVHEGRWELAASTWTENDRNMSNGESFARHYLYTRRYLSKMFDVSPEIFNLDYEPDCFGHSNNIPSILKNAGVKYYYHCRGNDTEILYNWQAENGDTVLSYREPRWYGTSINPNAFTHIPKVCKDLNISEMLYVYGVGDHGGGPTRRDIEAIVDMNTWPLMAKLEFSTYAKFFEYAQMHKENFPTVVGELNFTLTGCYTSTSRIKMANRYSEASLVKTEASSVMSNYLTGHDYATKALETAWRDTMFNQFHDILPGCGIHYTKEFALGKFQEILSISNTKRVSALNEICESIDTTKIKCEDAIDNVFGVGNSATRMYGVSGISTHTGISGQNNFSGSKRLFTIFNQTEFERDEVVDIMLWDFSGDVDNIIASDIDGNELKIDVINRESMQYWAHFYTIVRVKVKVLPLGYNTIVISEDTVKQRTRIATSDPRIARYFEYKLENDNVLVKFDPLTMAATSMLDKKTGIDILNGGKTANFKMKYEQFEGSSAWVVGKFINRKNDKFIVKNIKHKEGKTFDSITYKLFVDKSEFDVTIMLQKDKRNIEFNVTALWDELGSEEYIPNFSYGIETCTEDAKITYDVPMGIVKRKKIDDDVCGLTFAHMAINDKMGVYFATESKYGYRAFENEFSLSLLRNSRNPNTHPDCDVHMFDFSVGFGCVVAAYKCAKSLSFPLEYVSTRPNNKGKLSSEFSLFDYKNSNVFLSSIKKCEDSDLYLLKLYNTSEEEEEIVFESAKSVAFADLHEEEIEKVEKSGKGFTIKIKAKDLIVLKISL